MTGGVKWLSETYFSPFVFRTPLEDAFELSAKFGKFRDDQFSTQGL
jgi:hypothetical protein